MDWFHPIVIMIALATPPGWPHQWECWSGASTPGTRGLGLQLVDTEKHGKSGHGKSCHAAVREAGDSPGHKAGGTFLPFIMVWVSGGQNDSEMQMCLLETTPVRQGRQQDWAEGEVELNCDGDTVRAQRILQEPQHREGSAWLSCTVAKGQSGDVGFPWRGGAVWIGSSLYPGQHLRGDSAVTHRAGRTPGSWDGK